MSGIADAQNTIENTKINILFSQRPVKINRFLIYEKNYNTKIKKTQKKRQQKLQHKRKSDVNANWLLCKKQLISFFIP